MDNISNSQLKKEILELKKEMFKLSKRKTTDKKDELKKANQIAKIAGQLLRKVSIYSKNYGDQDFVMKCCETVKQYMSIELIKISKQKNRLAN